MTESETITENIFRSYYGATTFIEKSAIPKEYGFKSKKGTNYKGYPDFFLDDLANSYVIIVEAKANDQKQAEIETCFYLENNEVYKDSIGIAISGQKEEELNVSFFIKSCNEAKATKIQTSKEFFSLADIKKLYNKSKQTEKITSEDLHKTLIDLNKRLHSDNIVGHSERSLFFSGIMIALKDSTFRNSYKMIQAPTPEETQNAENVVREASLLNEQIISAITRQLKNKINNLSKEYNWQSKFSFFENISYPLIKYKRLIQIIQDKIFIPFENEEKLDILGKAYKIFLSRAGKTEDKNIILTPDHIKSLMVKLARLTIDDVILDTCTGSGGFLMESMETLIKLADGNSSKIKNIKEKQLIGFENDAVLFALACSNMFLHGDGRTNLIFRSSLLNDETDNIVNSSDKDLLSFIKGVKPTKIIINPPYENNKSIKFVLQGLKYLEPNGKLIIIMPTPTLTHNQQDGGLTKEVLSIAKLDFVIRMPERLFSEQDRTVNTSIFGFTKTPHNPKDKVLFYNLEDDGFVSIQHKGKVDIYNTWERREQEIIDSILYDSSKTEKRVIYNPNGTLNCSGIQEQRNSNYQLAKIGDLFNYQKGTLQSSKCNEGEYDFITADSEWKKHDSYTNDEEAIVFAVGASGSLGKTHYVNGKFIASNLCIILTSKGNSKYPINLKFYKYYFDNIRRQIKLDLADGTSKLTIRPEDLMEYYIDYIPYDAQISFVKNKINEFEKKQKEILREKKIILDDFTDLLKG